MKLQIAKIVGVSTESGWSQVHTFAPEEKEKLEKRGQLLAVISLTSLPFGTEIALAGKELISRLHEEYFGNLEEKPFFQLKNSLEKVFAEASREAKVEIVAGSVVGDVLYLAIAGGGKVVLARGGKVGEIIGGGSGEVETASGYLQKGDIFLLGTKKFFEVVPREVLGAALAGGSASSAVEALTPVVLGKEEGLAAAVVAGVEEEMLPAEEKPLAEEFPKKRFEKKLRLEAIKKFFSEIKRKITAPPSQKPKKSLFTVALILFLILGVSMVFGAKERKRQAAERKVAAVLEQVKAKKEEGEAILGLNPAKAKEILKEAEELLKQVEGEKIASPQLEKIKQELQASLDAVLKEYEVEAKLFFDLELIKKGAVGSDFAFSAGQLVVLDKENLAVYSIGVADKNSAILAGGEEIKEAKKVVAFWPKIFVFGKEGIFQIDAKDKSKKLAVKTDNEWQDIRDFQTFGGNLYLLDKKAIWQYPAFVEASGGQAAFGAKRGWLKREADFSQAVEMAIDGAIWVLKEEGEVEKYLRGNKESFGVSGLDKPFSEPKGIYTDFEAEYLYILDKGNSRIAVLRKGGEYFAQYKNPQIANAQDFVVWEKEGKIFLLEGSKIYEIELRVNS